MRAKWRVEHVKKEETKMDDGCYLERPIHFSRVVAPKLTMWKSMERMYGAEEMHWDHAQLPVSRVYQCYLVFSAICLVFAAWTASQEQPLHENNFVEFLDQLMRDRAKWTNGTIYISEVIDSLNPGHPLHLLYNRTQLRYDFGTSYYNYCKRASGTILVYSQCTVSKVVLQQVKQRELLLTCGKYYHSINDGAIANLDQRFLWVRAKYPGRAHYSRLKELPLEESEATGLAYLEAGDVILADQSDIALFIVRVLGFGVFAVSMPSVYENYLSYLQFKPCHTHVSPSTAIKEYICLCVIVLFSLSQVRDYNPLMMNLTALRYDTIPSNDRADYSPDFMTSRFDSAPFASMRTWKVSSTI
ncbi:unnamed protein product [Heligmosomoides polygyrus]|uniref:Pep_M12B_propep domain-containing protein n=1 Tax=Heligmosomoides polygyrus TaxID=6339 RepID=A0A3P8A208_HELPZ|nr:unnamed protein product [Heligmosomoides polygyrus]